MNTMPTSAIATMVRPRPAANRQFVRDRATDADEGAQHQQLALREVDDLHGVEDQQQAKGDESIDAPERQAVDDELAHEGISIRFL